LISVGVSVAKAIHDETSTARNQEEDQQRSKAKRSIGIVAEVTIVVTTIVATIVSTCSIPSAARTTLVSTAVFVVAARPNDFFWTSLILEIDVSKLRI
jgi:hypothetical protein